MLSTSSGAGRVRRSHPQGREGGRPAGPGADQVRAGHQSQNGQKPRPRRAADAACHRRRGDRMNRRDFITLLGGAAAWPLAARAQQAATPVIGHLDPTSPGDFAEPHRGFLQGLKETGYVESENVAISHRFAENQTDRLPELAADLVRRQVAVIFTFASGVFAAKGATTTIPVVFVVADDPVRLVLVRRKPARCHRTSISVWMVLIAFTIDGNHRYNCSKNRRSLFVNWTRPRTWRRSTIS